MDDDTNELLIRLLTRAGMIMEDASVIALTIGALKGEDRIRALAELALAAETLSRLIDAARVLDR